MRKVLLDGLWWEVAEDGTMSRNGQTLFPVYGADGKLTSKCVTYQLVNEELGVVFAAKLSNKEAKALAEQRA